MKGNAEFWDQIAELRDAGDALFVAASEYQRSAHTAVEFGGHDDLIKHGRKSMDLTDALNDWHHAVTDGSQPAPSAGVGEFGWASNHRRCTRTTIHEPHTYAGSLFCDGKLDPFFQMACCGHERRFHNAESAKCLLPGCTCHGPGDDELPASDPCKHSHRTAEVDGDVWECSDCGYSEEFKSVPDAGAVCAYGEGIPVAEVMIRPTPDVETPDVAYRLTPKGRAVQAIKHQLRMDDLTHDDGTWVAAAIEDVAETAARALEPYLATPSATLDYEDIHRAVRDEIGNTTGIFSEGLATNVLTIAGVVSRGVES